ncbi:WbqC family protein [Streptomyces sp. NPDC006879]|uniref:WbqC family protein n=1 Tax=Streptomyces sp. NPDC006879 TaxID=3364767 RepID=UPI0036A71F61
MTRTSASWALASTASSSVPDASAVPSGAVCAIHQPNFFPRLSTLAKLFAVDVWVVLDEVQFARRDYQHRARLADLGDRRWLSLATHLPQGRRAAGPQHADPRCAPRGFRTLPSSDPGPDTSVVRAKPLLACGEAGRAASAGDDQHDQVDGRGC